MLAELMEKAETDLLTSLINPNDYLPRVSQHFGSLIKCCIDKVVLERESS